MHTTKNISLKTLTSPDIYKTAAQSILSPQANSLGILATKDQQQRIERLINEVRKGGPLGSDASLLPHSEILRMKRAANFATKDEKLQQKKVLEEQIEKQQATSKAKKTKMIEIETERKKNVPLTDVELEKLEKENALRERAQDLLDEERDDVKSMNKMILYAQVVTLRDKQLKDKAQVHHKVKTEEKAKDLLMELERLKKIKYYEELDAFKLSEQKKAAAETINQIRQRELVRARAREERDREGQEMIQKIKDNALEDAKDNFAKKKYQKDLLDIVFVENHKAIAHKQLVIQKEREEEERIHKYNLDKARKDAEYQAEVKRINDAKEAETIKLRKLQEKFADRQAEIDAIRAKRAFESADRLAREKERKEAETKRRLNEELLEARHFQHLEKERRLQEQAREERDEFQKIVSNQKMERNHEVRMDQEKKDRVNEHSNQLKKQMAINEEKKMQEKRMSLEEGKKIKDKLFMEKALLENIKNRKLGYLNQHDIPVKYTSELARKRIII